MTHAASAFAFPNLMMEHPWTAKDHERHRARVQQMKPSIDCTVPSSYYVMINRAKKDQQNEEWCARVDRDNELLLSRMAHVMTHHSILAEQQASSKQTWHHVSPNELNRKAEQRRIETENKTILQRLKHKTSSYPAASWKTHAKQFDKHSKEMKARRELIRNPHLIPTSPTNNKKATVRRLKPIKQQQDEWPRDADGNVIYDRQVEDIDEQQAAMKAEEEEKEAVISSFSFSAGFSDDAERAGPSDLVEHTIPEGAEVEQIYQSGHEIDGRQVIVSMDECNAISSKRATQPSETDDWGSFTAHPPSILHALLIRTYDLDSALHSHLYLPFAPLRSLGKTRAERCARIVPLLGFNQDGELFFKQSLIKGQKKKTKRAQPKKEAFVQARINKIEKKIAEEQKEQAPSPSDAHDEPDAEAESDAEADQEQPNEQSDFTQSQEREAESAPVNEDDMRPETAEFAVEAPSNSSEDQYEADPEQSVDAPASDSTQEASAADQEFETDAEPQQAEESSNQQVDDALKGATQPFTTQVNEPSEPAESSESADSEFESDPQPATDSAPVEAAPADAEFESESQPTDSAAAEAEPSGEAPVAAVPAESEFESDPAPTQDTETQAPAPAAESEFESDAAPATEIEQPAEVTTSKSSDAQPAETTESQPEPAAESIQPTVAPVAADSEFESDASEPAAASDSKPTTPMATQPIQQGSAKPSPRVPTLSRPTSNIGGVSPRLLAVEISRPSSKSGSKPTTPRLAPLSVAPSVAADAPPAIDRPLSKASPRLEPLSQAHVSPRVDAPITKASRSASPRTYDNDECDEDVKRQAAAIAEAPVIEPAVEAATAETEQPAAVIEQQQAEEPSVEHPVEPQADAPSEPQPQAQEESYADDTHAQEAAVTETAATEATEPTAETAQSAPEQADQATSSEPEQTEQPAAVESEQASTEPAAEENYEDDHHIEPEAVSEPAAATDVAPVTEAAPEAEVAATEDYSADKEFPDDE